MMQVIVCLVLMLNIFKYVHAENGHLALSTKGDGFQDLLLHSGSSLPFAMIIFHFNEAIFCFLE